MVKARRYWRALLSVSVSAGVSRSRVPRGWSLRPLLSLARGSHVVVHHVAVAVDVPVVVPVVRVKERLGEVLLGVVRRRWAPRPSYPRSGAVRRRLTYSTHSTTENRD